MNDIRCSESRPWKHSRWYSGWSSSLKSSLGCIPGLGTLKTGMNEWELLVCFKTMTRDVDADFREASAINRHWFRPIWWRCRDGSVQNGVNFWGLEFEDKDKQIMWWKENRQTKQPMNRIIKRQRLERDAQHSLRNLSMTRLTACHNSYHRVIRMHQSHISFNHGRSILSNRIDLLLRRWIGKYGSGAS